MIDALRRRFAVDWLEYIEERMNARAIVEPRERALIVLMALREYGVYAPLFEPRISEVGLDLLIDSLIVKFQPGQSA